MGPGGRPATDRGPNRGSAPRPHERPAHGGAHGCRHRRRATAEAKRLRLPLHRDLPKNWDALGAVAAVLDLVDDGTRSARIMDAGSARYSPVLPWLRLYGFGAAAGSLIGINLEFGSQVTHATASSSATATSPTPGCPPATSTPSPACRSSSTGCRSRASSRSRPGCCAPEASSRSRPTTTRDPPDTTGKVIYGSRVHIFSPREIRDLVAMADRHDLELVGTLDDRALSHTERPVHWGRVDLDYTFILLTFRRR
ncbi:hypothetical protein LP422_15120 [Janibacter limosus]|uniref:Uncharacterized protein n=1 Tax=Janibacter limosus TaxID=53458 RepID=A0AC61U1W5_9MICO|nr:hypothetical protein [Janibacter limosus]UUZ43991.1 hypothetical protein LP422_15120 [Janibacter limosus]